MAKKIGSDRPLGPHFIREWRKFRGLSLEKLAERIETTAASISRIEKGLQPYSQEFLEAAAEALNCETADLLKINPLIPREIEVLSLWREASPDVKKIINSILKTGTQG